MRSHLPKLLFLGILTGCDSSTGPFMCTRELRYGIEMAVVNANSGVPSASGATMTLREGAYLESVARSGYHSWVQTDVRVTADECHVQTVSLRAQLEQI